MKNSKKIIECTDHQMKVLGTTLWIVLVVAVAITFCGSAGVAGM
jgi:hypothetical protein